MGFRVFPSPKGEAAQQLGRPGTPLHQQREGEVKAYLNVLVSDQESRNIKKFMLGHIVKGH